jgi:hypothetical protein
VLVFLFDHIGESGLRWYVVERLECCVGVDERLFPVALVTGEYLAVNVGAYHGGVISNLYVPVARLQTCS